MALSASDTNRNPVAVAYVDGSSLPVLASAANPLPVTVSGLTLENSIIDVDTSELETLLARPATATRTSVDSVTTAGGVNILASNANRKGGTITNTDANALYLMFAATGSVAATDFDVKLLTDETLVLDRQGYTGVICGIWAGNGSGAAKVCEFT